jgi:hypothetical protein
MKDRLAMFLRVTSLETADIIPSFLNTPCSLVFISGTNVPMQPEDYSKSGIRIEFRINGTCPDIILRYYYTSSIEMR